MARNGGINHSHIHVRMRACAHVCLHARARYRSVVNIMPRLLYPPMLKTPNTHWIKGWAGPRASLDNLVKRKISCPGPDPKFLINQPTA